MSSKPSRSTHTVLHITQKLLLVFLLKVQPDSDSQAEDGPATLRCMYATGAYIWLGVSCALLLDLSVIMWTALAEWFVQHLWLHCVGCMPLYFNVVLCMKRARAEVWTVRPFTWMLRVLCHITVTAVYWYTFYCVVVIFPLCKSLMSVALLAGWWKSSLVSSLIWKVYWEVLIAMAIACMPAGVVLQLPLSGRYGNRLSVSEMLVAARLWHDHSRLGQQHSGLMLTMNVHFYWFSIYCGSWPL